jgi:hypothetical protein
MRVDLILGLDSLGYVGAELTDLQDVAGAKPCKHILFNPMQQFKPAVIGKSRNLLPNASQGSIVSPLEVIAQLTSWPRAWRWLLSRQMMLNQTNHLVQHHALTRQ